MIGSVLTKVFGSKHQREIKKLWPLVDEINRHFQDLGKLSDEQLQAKTAEFKDIIAAEKTAGRTERELLDDLLPEAFAVVKDACRRHVGKSWDVCGIDLKWNDVPFDTQLIGGMVLHHGKIAEMATGEGKTLVATLPLYLNALTGRGVHLVTVNDYLARRDSQWMGRVFRFLGLTVGCLDDTEPGTPERRAMYRCDVVYGTNNEFGFDYLRDNMAVSAEQCVQREYCYAIVDEVDSALVDEARTPLIISGPVEHSTHRYDELKRPVERLVESQTLLVNKIVAEAEQLLSEGKDYEAGIKLLQALRGAPKNKRLAKLLKEGGNKKQMQDVENDYIRDKKMSEIDEELLFSIDEKSHVVDLTEKGRQALSPRDPDLFVIPDLLDGFHSIDADETLSAAQRLARKQQLETLFSERSEKNQNIAQLLRAYSLFEKDVEYVVSDGKVLIVDEFTGRLMPGRRYSDGLHQALEAKESVAIERETQTLATITIQNYFRLYEKLAGMTGTAETEASEFFEIYKLDVVVVPTNKPVRRFDYNDVIYRTKREKYNAVIDEIAQYHEAKLPVLVGTVSVEVSETLSRMLARRGIKHSVLNAKHHQKEAEIVSQAGQPGNVVIATNMAGRGTDIKLGPGVVKSPHCRLTDEDDSSEQCPHYEELKCKDEVPCGLHIIGTERHESRRIDRQLRGRAGRQGDPGSSRFYLALEDDLMRLFGSERIAGIMERLGAEEGEVLTHPLLTRQIETAQKRVEAHNFDIRKRLLEYDDVMNKQRDAVYKLRRRMLTQADLREEALDLCDQMIATIVGSHTDAKEYPENWNWQGLRDDLGTFFLMDVSISDKEKHGLTPERLEEMLVDAVRRRYQEKEQALTSGLMRQIERFVMLQVIDEKWREHLHQLDIIKEGIGLRAYGQKDPLIEYKKESYAMFMELMNSINARTVELLFKAHPVNAAAPQMRPAAMNVYKPELACPAPMAGNRAPEETAGPLGRQQQERPRMKPVVNQGPRVGRNEKCPCGSEKKYKKCCGANK
ncbi:MAG: preprotein translocase subunit SecA [Candidatus Edwardsbacteria bacterium]|nr:preprotein translocase subunit SecA [Candidatus Edwardsbacteria bacterium]